MDASDRRTAPRLARDTSLTVREIVFPIGSRPSVEVDMTDVSESGVGFRSPSPFPVGATLEVTFHLPGWVLHTRVRSRFREEEGPLTAVAVVTRCLPLADGQCDVGVRFTDIWDDHWRALRLRIEEMLAQR